MFDQLLLLTQRGEVVYFGDINEKQEPQDEEARNEAEQVNALEENSQNKAQSLLRYCEQYGYEMERERNPADFALEFATATNRLQEQHKKNNDQRSENNNEENEDNISPIDSSQEARMGGYVESVDELVQGYYQSELFAETEDEINNTKQVEIRPRNYQGFFQLTFLNIYDIDIANIYFRKLF